jgi:hypothetical protein
MNNTELNQEQRESVDRILEYSNNDISLFKTQIYNYAMSKHNLTADFLNVYFNTVDQTYEIVGVFSYLGIPFTITRSTPNMIRVINSSEFKDEIKQAIKIINKHHPHVGRYVEEEDCDTCVGTVAGVDDPAPIPEQVPEHPFVPNQVWNINYGVAADHDANYNIAAAPVDAIRRMGRILDEAVVPRNNHREYMGRFRNNINGNGLYAPVDEVAERNIRPVAIQALDPDGHAANHEYRANHGAGCMERPRF